MFSSLSYLVVAWSAIAEGSTLFDAGDTATKSSLHLVQSGAVAFAAPRARGSDKDRLAIDAHAVATASVEAAKRVEKVTAEIMSRNNELELENDYLREDGKIGNSSIGQLMAHVVFRSVPRHRVKHYEAIALDVQYADTYEEVLTFPKRRPWTTNVVIAILETFLADLLVQMLRATSTTTTSPKDGSRRYDWKRGVLFAIFGLFYVGIAQWFFYVSVFSKLLPDSMTFADKPLVLKLADKVGQEDLLIQVMVDQFIITPFVYFPIFYVLKEILRLHLRDDECKVPENSLYFLNSAMSNCIKNFWQDNLASMAVWFPADVVIFMAPMYLRMPLDHGVAFLWTMILSFMRGVTH